MNTVVGAMSKEEPQSVVLVREHFLETGSYVDFNSSSDVEMMNDLRLSGAQSANSFFSTTQASIQSFSTAKPRKPLRDTHARSYSQASWLSIDENWIERKNFVPPVISATDQLSSRTLNRAVTLKGEAATGTRREELRQIFDKIDADHGGTLDREEVRFALMQMGKTQAEANKVLRRIPKPELTFEDFCEYADIAAETKGGADRLCGQNICWKLSDRFRCQCIDILSKHPESRTMGEVLQLQVLTGPLQACRDVPEDLHFLMCKQAKLRSLQQGEIAVAEGERANKAFIVMTGCLAVVKRGGTGLGTVGTAPQVVKRLQPGEIFGDISMGAADKNNLRVVRTVSLVAEGPTELLALEYEAMGQRFLRAKEQFLRSRLKILKKCELFREWKGTNGEEAIIRLCHQMKYHKCKPKEVIVQEGQKSSGIGIILYGNAKATKCTLVKMPDLRPVYKTFTAERLSNASVFDQHCHKWALGKSAFTILAVDACEVLTLPNCYISELYKFDNHASLPPRIEVDVHLEPDTHIIKTPWLSERLQQAHRGASPAQASDTSETRRSMSAGTETRRSNSPADVVSDLLPRHSLVSPLSSTKLGREALASNQMIDPSTKGRDVEDSLEDSVESSLSGTPIEKPAMVHSVHHGGAPFTGMRSSMGKNMGAGPTRRARGVSFVGGLSMDDD
jgi:hypothetical protein